MNLTQSTSMKYIEVNKHEFKYAELINSYAP